MRGKGGKRGGCGFGRRGVEVEDDESAGRVVSQRGQGLRGTAGRCDDSMIGAGKVRLGEAEADA